MHGKIFPKYGKKSPKSFLPNVRKRVLETQVDRAKDEPPTKDKDHAYIS